MSVADFLFVILLGALVGAGELISRYRDAPARALGTTPAMLYIALNASAAAFALWSIRVFGWNFGVDPTKVTQLHWTQVLAGGFGAMALFRTSLFTVRAGDQDIGVGPITFLNVVLAASDRAVDRLRARARSTAVAAAMANVSFRRAQAALPAYCLALMQNLSRDDQESLARQVAALANAPFDDRIKSLTLGLNLMNAVGGDVLQAAIESLGSRIARPAEIEIGLSRKFLAGQIQAAVVHVFGANREPLARDGVLWVSSDAGVAQVSQAGVVTTVGAGKAIISAELDGVVAEVEITVDPISAAVQTPAPNLPLGASSSSGTTQDVVQ